MSPTPSSIQPAGLPVDEPSLAKRLSQLVEQDGYHLWLACSEEKILAFVGFALMWMFEADDSYVRILALVVEQEHRRQGLATDLLEAVKEWAKAKGATALALHSGLSPEREGAHLFYKKQGFEQASLGFTCRL